MFRVRKRRSRAGSLERRAAEVGRRTCKKYERSKKYNRGKAIIMGFPPRRKCMTKRSPESSIPDAVGINNGNESTIFVRSCFPDN